MLRLLATHYPHLCLVEDWISEEEHLQISNNSRQTQMASPTSDQQQQVVDEEVINLLRKGLDYSYKRNFLEIFDSITKVINFICCFESKGGISQNNGYFFNRV